MKNKTEKIDLLHKYVPQLKELKPLAEQAFGSRDTGSDAHEASRQYTTLLTEYVQEGGSLLMMAEALEVTYPALNRRVMTADLKPRTRRRRSTATPEQYAKAVASIQPLRDSHNTEAYHDALLSFYNEGLSMKQLALALGLKAEYPLYYGLDRARRRAGEANA